MENLNDKDKKKVIISIAVCIGVLIALMIIGILM